MKQIYDPSKDPTLKDKPFTKKLLLNVSELYKTTENELKEMAYPFKLAKIEKSDTFEKLTTSSIVTVAHEITNNSLEENDDLTYGAGSNKKLAIIVAFSLFSVLAIETFLKDEKVSIDEKKLGADHLNLFLLIDKSKERLKMIEKGQNYFQSIIKARDKKAEEWFNQLLTFINGYVIFFDNSGKKAKISNALKMLFSAFAKTFEQQESFS